MSALTAPPGWNREETNRWIEYHSRISHRMTYERTALESALMPVTAYILVAAVECYRRYPELMSEIAAAMPPEEIGARGRVPGNQVDAVHLWSIANVFLVGRQLLVPFGLVDVAADPDRSAVVLDFWKRAAATWRSDGHLQSWDAGFVTRPYGAETVETLVRGTRPLRDVEERRSVERLNATLTSYLFLLYFDTRAGYQDSGPYPLPGGRVLLTRDFASFGVSHFPWSAAIAADLPCANVTAAFVLDGVGVRVNDWGTAVTEPADYLPRVEAAGFFASDGGALRPLLGREVDELAAAVRDAQRRLYRLVATMSRTEKLDAGAYVYFTFLWPFAEVAGIADRLDWTVPRDSRDVYDALAVIEHVPILPPGPESPPYYAPIE